MGYTQEQIDRANQVNLEQFLRLYKVILKYVQ